MSYPASLSQVQSGELAWRGLLVRHLVLPDRRAEGGPPQAARSSGLTRLYSEA